MAAIAVSAFLVLLCGGLGIWLMVRKQKPRPDEEVEAEVCGMETERASIQQQLAQLEEKMEELRQQALKAREEARKAEVDAAVAAAEAAAVAAAGEATEELLHLKEEAEAAAAAMQEQLMKAEVTAEQMRRLGEQAVEKTGQIRQMMVEGADQAYSQLEAFVRETVKTLTSQMEEVLSTEASQDDVESWVKEVEDASGQALRMPLPLLVAGLFAPMQLQVMISWNWVLFAVQFPLLVAFLIVMLVDWGKRCGDNELWIWAYVMVALLKASVMVRLRVMRSAAAALAETKCQEEAGQGMLGEAHPLQKFYKRVMSSSKEYLKVLLAYDSLASSSISSLVSFMTFVLLIWGGVGVYFVIVYAVIQENSCSAGALRGVSRVYAFLYVAALLWSIIALVLWIVQMLLTSKSVALLVLEKVWSLDDLYSPSGFPVVSILVRALLLRSEKDMTNMEASILRGEIMELREKKAELAKQEAALDSVLGAAERRLKAASGEGHRSTSADELASLYSQDLAVLMDKVAIFTLAVQAQVERLGPSAMDSMQSAATDSKKFLEEATQKASQQAKSQAAFLAESAQESAQQLATAALLKAEECGVELPLDMQQAQCQAARLADAARESAQQLAMAALLKAEASGVDIEAIAMQVQKEAAKLAAAVQDEAAMLAAQAPDDLVKLAGAVQDEAAVLAAQAQEEAAKLAPEAAKLAAAVQDEAAVLAAQAQEQGAQLATAAEELSRNK